MNSMLKLIKKSLRKPTPFEVIATELAEAHLARLQAETAVDYAQSVVDYNITRIERLCSRIEEYT